MRRRHYLTLEVWIEHETEAIIQHALEAGVERTRDVLYERFRVVDASGESGIGEVRAGARVALVEGAGGGNSRLCVTDCGKEEPEQLEFGDMDTLSWWSQLELIRRMEGKE